MRQVESHSDMPWLRSDEKHAPLRVLDPNKGSGVFQLQQQQQQPPSKRKLKVEEDTLKQRPKRVKGNRRGPNHLALYIITKARKGTDKKELEARRLLSRALQSPSVSG